jgi:hypothetical protein
MKDLKHIKRFNEHQENLNISNEFVCIFESLNQNKMNTELYNKLVNQFKNETSVTGYESSWKWVNRHLVRLCTEFSFLEVGKPIKFEIEDTLRVANFEEFIVTDDFIGLDTGFGNIWYYEAKEPTKKELREFKKDGDCLVIKE